MAIALLRVETVAEMLSVHPRTIRRWIAETKIEAVNLGDDERPSYRIARSTLAHWLAERGLAMESTSSTLLHA